MLKKGVQKGNEERRPGKPPHDSRQPLRLEPIGLLMVTGENFIIRTVNKAFLSLTGNQESAIMGKPFFEIYPLIKDNFTPILNNVIESGVSFYGDELPVPISFAKKKKIFYLNIILHPVPSDNGKPDSIMAIIIDATKEAEAKRVLLERETRFKKMIKESRICMLLLRGEDFIIEYGNDRMFHDILATTPGDAIGKPLFKLFPELITQGYQHEMKSIYQNGEIIYKNEVPTIINTPEGPREYFFDYEFAPLRNEQEDINAIMVNMNDVTESVNTRLLQEENQRRIELSLDSGGLALWEMDLESQKLTCTPKLTEILGIENQNAGFDAFMQFVHPDDRERLRKAIRNGMVSGDFSFEGRFIRKNKPLLWLQVHGKIFFDKHAKPLKLIGSTRDITSEKAERLDLKRKEQRLKTLIFQAPVAIGILRGPDYKIEIINQVAFQLLGRTESDLKGKSFTKVMAEIDTNEAKRLLDLVYYKNQVVSANEYPIRLLRNGQPQKVYVNFECHPTLNSKGKAIGIMVVAYEVTNLVLNRKKIEESESRFRLLAESTSNFVSSLDRKGKMNYVNNTFKQFTGYSLEDVNNKGFLSIVHPDDVKKTRKKWEKIIKNGTGFINEQRIRKANGTYRWFLTTALPETGSSGKIEGWVFNSTDIQEIKEQELQKDYFISRASHELKTPMTSIKGYIQILKLIHENSTDRVLTQSLEKMEFQVNKLTHLIDDLLDTTRIGKEGLKVALKPFTISEAIRESIDEVRLSTDYNIIFKKTRQNIMVLGDPEKIGQVITNLLTNAIKYSPSSQKVWINTSIHDNSIRVSITDKGIGIPTAAQKKIFEKFYRVTGKNEETFPGLGIGLYIANEILRLHQSRIFVTSEPGKGSTFYFDLKIYYPSNKKVKPSA